MGVLNSLPKKIRRPLLLLLRAALCWNLHRGTTMGAAIAFYTLFSMGPVLTIAILIASYFFGHASAEAGLLAQVNAVLGPKAASAVSAVIHGVARPDQAWWQMLLALGTTLFAATTVFNELKNSLDVIWNSPPQHVSIVALLRSRLLSFGIVLAVGFILMVSLLLSTALTALEDRYSRFFGAGLLWVKVLSNVLATLVIALLFGAIFKLLPERKVAWRDIWYGAILTACLFMVGKSLIAMYLGTTALASSYGAAGALVLILLWIYYSAQVFLFGAELSRQMARRRMHRRLRRQQRQALPPGKEGLHGPV